MSTIPVSYFDVDHSLHMDGEVGGIPPNELNRVASVEHAHTERRFEQVIGESPALESVLTKVECVAPTDATVLVLGERRVPARN